MTEIKVECQGPTGTTTATAAKRAIDATATGTLVSVTVTEDANHDGLFVVTLTYDESDPANEPLGSWGVTVGGTINTLTMTAADNLVGYKAELPNVPTAENISDRLEREGGPIDSVPKYGDSQQRDKTSASSSQLVETVTKVEE